MMTFPINIYIYIYGKIKNVPNHQPVIVFHENILPLGIPCWVSVVFWVQKRFSEQPRIIVGAGYRQAPKSPAPCVGVSPLNSRFPLSFSGDSMDWFKGKSTGKPHVSWENRWFPVNFPLNQSNQRSMNNSGHPIPQKSATVGQTQLGGLDFGVN